MVAYKLAQEIFETYAGEADADVIAAAGQTIHAEQVRLAQWMRRNFAAYDDRSMALGIVEELGEYTRAEEEGDANGVVDAIGDVAIFAGQLLLANRLSIAPLIINVSALRTHVSWWHRHALEAAGRIAHVVLKRTQRIRGFECEAYYRRRLFEGVAALMNFLPCADTTYLYIGSAVRKRNWQVAP